MRLIEGYGIPTDGVVRDREHSTTATVVTVGADGEHGCMTLRNGAAGNMRYSTDVFDIDLGAPGWFPSPAFSGAGARPMRI